jgi:hypothetical protein
MFNDLRVLAPRKAIDRLSANHLGHFAAFVTGHHGAKMPQKLRALAIAESLGIFEYTKRSGFLLGMAIPIRTARVTPLRNLRLGRF